MSKPIIVAIISLMLIAISSLYFLAPQFWKTNPNQTRSDTASNTTEKTCHWHGHIDSPTKINTDHLEIKIQGWAFAAPKLHSVEIRVNDTVLARGNLTLSRNDVATQFPDCASTNSGFSIPLSLSQIPPQSQQLQVFTIDTNAGRQLLGTLPVDLSQPFISIDAPQGPIEGNARNVLSGWSLSSRGPVSIRVLAQDSEIAQLNNHRVRDDVGTLYQSWPEAKYSGFETLIAMHKLPRGRYPLILELTGTDGQQRQLEGPMVINDLPIARVLSDAWQMIKPETLDMHVWVWDEDTIESVSVETQSGQRLGQLKPIKTQVPYTDVIKITAKKKLLSPLASQLGSVYRGIIKLDAVTQPLTRIQVVAHDHSGHSGRYPGPILLAPSTVATDQCSGDAFRVFFPVSADILEQGLAIMPSFRAVANNGCIKVGIGGRVEYLRTTLGRDQDFIFDPDFPKQRRMRHQQSMSTHALNELLQHALERQVPLQISLDGGPWADARFPAADVDIVDWLEDNDMYVQWNQFGRPEADDALNNLPGAGKNPQLARMMTLNRFNHKFLAYKKRNLQAAVQVIRQTMDRHPQLDVQINLDPDEYINPWFYLSQWYDYNPNTLQQFREWLTGNGPYADGEIWADYRYPQTLNLKQINQLAHAHWQSIDQIDPPRQTPDYSDPWQQIWTQFKRHLVARHYNLLARWAAEAGMPKDRIFTSQTFIQADVAVSINDTATGWTDQAGVSIAGAKPDQGHLGVILYGPASRNEGKPRSGHSLFENIRSIDKHWGIVEYNPATIEFPEQLPTHQQAYQSIRQIFNSGARFISLMNGAHAADQALIGDNYHSYEALQATDYEYQLLWWLRKRQTFPLGSLLYPFGNQQVASDDGWSTKDATRLQSIPGQIILTSTQKTLSLSSPTLTQYSLKSGATVSIEGYWNNQVTLSLRAVLDNNDTLAIQVNTTSRSKINAVIPPSQTHLKQLVLTWDTSQSAVEKSVQIEQISIRF